MQIKTDANISQTYSLVNFIYAKEILLFYLQEEHFNPSIKFVETIENTHYTLSHLAAEAVYIDAIYDSEYKNIALVYGRMFETM